MTRYTGNGARRNAAFRYLVTVIRSSLGPGIGRSNHFSSIDFGGESQLCRIDRGAALRKQQVAEDDSRTLETIREVVHFGNDLEAIENVGGRGDESWKIAESCAEHLPQIALFRFGGN